MTWNSRRRSTRTSPSRQKTCGLWLAQNRGYGPQALTYCNLQSCIIQRQDPLSRPGNMRTSCRPRWPLKGRKWKRDCSQLPRGQIGLCSGVGTVQRQIIPSSEACSGAAKPCGAIDLDILRVRKAVSPHAFEKEALTNQTCTTLLVMGVGIIA